LNMQDFSVTFFVYKFFYKFLYDFFYKGSHTPEWRKLLFIKSIIHHFWNSIIHELNNS
jgi:hypothetical protein